MPRRILPLLFLLNIAAAPPPAPDVPIEEGGRRFNLSHRGGEPADSLAKALKHFYYNLAGKGAIRDGIAHQEQAVLKQPGARLDPAQGAVYASILRSEAAMARLYDALRGVALELERPKTPGRQEAVSYGLAGAEELFKGLPGLVLDAGRWHAAAYRAAGGSGASDLTGQALGNGVLSAEVAMDEARSAVAAWQKGSPEAAARAKAGEASALPELPAYNARLAVGELPAAPPAEPRRGSPLGDRQLLRRFSGVSFDGPDNGAPH